MLGLVSEYLTGELTSFIGPHSSCSTSTTIFEGAGMPYAAVNDVLATLTHEHTIARNMVVEIEHEECGPMKLVNSPVKYSETKPSIRSPPPTLGQHSDEILREHLGYDEGRIRELREKGVVR